MNHNEKISVDKLTKEDLRMNKFKGYINYGCLVAEKRPVFTAGMPINTATISEEVEYTVPKGWELEKNEYGEYIVMSPWGWEYHPNDLLAGKENPCFSGINKDGRNFKVDLGWEKI